MRRVANPTTNIALEGEASGPHLKKLLGRPLSPEEIEAARTMVATSGAIDATLDVGQISESVTAMQASATSMWSPPLPSSKSPG